MNKAALAGLPVALLIAGALNGGLAAVGGQPNIWSVLVVALIAWGAATSAIARMRADSGRARR